MADVRYFGITSDADIDAAMKFVEYSMSDGYKQTLFMAPEGMFPVRKGTADDANAFQTEWAKLGVGVDRKAPLSDLYPQDVIDGIVLGLNTAKRWGVTEGQLGLASKIINAQIYDRYVREYTDGVRDGTATVAKLNEELAKVN